MLIVMRMYDNCQLIALILNIFPKYHIMMPSCPEQEFAHMKFEYFQDADMLYISLAEETSTESEEVAPGVVIDFDEHNRIVGVEIEDASKFIDLSRLELKALPVTNLILTDPLPVGR